MNTDVLVLGAGVTGLTAACLLKRAGLRVEVVEARDRVGGRILTRPSPFGVEPIELGAELVHGFPDEARTWVDPAMDLEVRDGDFLIFEHGQLTSSPDYFMKVSQVLEQLPQELESDLAVREWLSQAEGIISVDTHGVKNWVEGYIQGYHAADLAQMSTEVLGQIERESQEVGAVEGAQFFRGGQGQFVDRLVREFNQPILLNHEVQKVIWSSEGVEVMFKSSQLAPIQARRVVITLPIGVLQNASEKGGVVFHPPLPDRFIRALSYFKMGTALRMNFVFKPAPWSFAPHLPDFGMILDPSPDALFRVWWKRGEHQIVGWNGGPLEIFRQPQSPEVIQELGLKALARLFSIPQDRLQGTLIGFYSQDWKHDPYSRGVYPYVKVGGKSAAQTYATPIEDALYFAGDAECIGAYLGTVNGAIQSGTRVARVIQRESNE